MKRFIKTAGRHRTLEGWPLVFTILVTLSILVGGFVEFLPLVLIQENVPRIENVEPWTPLEIAGRDIYIREGCNNCHSQMVRPFRQEIERYGEYGKPGETVYEHPFLWGSKRTGPDLARVGGKYPNLWHVRHMENPRSTSPNSIMPPYDWLLRKPLNTSTLSARLGTLQKLGVPYSDDEVANAVTLAQEQARTIADDVEATGGPSDLADREIIAVVAYLQSLGSYLQPNSAAAPEGNAQTTADLAQEVDQP